MQTTAVVYADSGMDQAHPIEKAPEKRALLLKYLFAQNIVWVTANTLIRTSILLLFVDIFPVATFITFCHGFLALNVVFCLEVIMFRFFVCLPLHYNWDPLSAVNKDCRSRVTHAAFVNGVINILLDSSMVIMPMPVLWSLRMDVKRKLALSIVFGVGVLICVLSVLRVAFIQATQKKATSFTSVAYGSLAILEPLLGIVNACMPFLKPILVRFWPSTMAATMSYGQSGSSRAFRYLQDRELVLESRAGVGSSASTRKINVYQPPD